LFDVTGQICWFIEQETVFMWYRSAKIHIAQSSPAPEYKLDSGERLLVQHLDEFAGDQMPRYEFDLSSNDPEAPRHYFIADTHFGDARKIMRDRRPQPEVFTARSPQERIQEHLAHSDNVMRERWNETVRPQDHVWIVGDFGAHKTREETQAFLDTLRGNKHLIEGGHDLYSGRDAFNRDVFHSVQPHAYLTYRMPDGSVRNLYLRHNYNIYDNDADHAEWHGKEDGSVFLYGHTHGTHDDRPHENSLDVGTDIYGYQPLSLQEIDALLSQKDRTRKRVPANQFGALSQQKAKELGITKRHQRDLWDLSFRNPSRV
jgi:calcineurin-like phosphoesterase family protein